MTNTKRQVSEDELVQALKRKTQPEANEMAVQFRCPVKRILKEEAEEENTEEGSQGSGGNEDGETGAAPTASRHSNDQRNSIANSAAEGNGDIQEQEVCGKELDINVLPTQAQDDVMDMVIQTEGYMTERWRKGSGILQHSQYVGFDPHRRMSGKLSLIHMTKIRHQEEQKGNPLTEERGYTQTSEKDWNAESTCGRRREGGQEH
ncbi:hypothetical protein R1sor_017956 [Riccia sorocarpa]|uniref:Uncharacterized protein n=1 Tax=Riccia sorocarpa TaxID=122646 RepID=A0ABD3IEJ8_9MARC